MKLVYLDYNCFQREFDDSGQIKIQMEALACQEIFNMTERKELQLVWSFMHQDETLVCPFPLRKYEVLRLATLCKVRVGPTEEILQLARSFQEKSEVRAKDALHLACAVESKARYFLTCDDRLLKQAQKLDLVIMVMNPVDYIRREKN